MRGLAVLLKRTRLMRAADFGGLCDCGSCDGGGVRNGGMIVMADINEVQYVDENDENLVSIMVTSAAVAVVTVDEAMS